MTNPTIEVDIAEILKEIQEGQKKILDKVETIDKRLIKVETKIDEGITPRLDTLSEQVKEVKETQKALVSDVADLKGAKSLVIPIVVAVTASILTLVIRAIPGV